MPWTPLLGPAVRVVAERQQRGHVVVGDEPDVAALAAVAAVRAAEGDRTLAPERHAARAAVAAAHVELALVDELGHRTNATGGLRSRRSGARSSPRPARHSTAPALGCDTPFVSSAA